MITQRIAQITPISVTDNSYVNLWHSGRNAIQCYRILYTEHVPYFKQFLQMQLLCLHFLPLNQMKTETPRGSHCRHRDHLQWQARYCLEALVSKERQVWEESRCLGIHEKVLWAFVDSTVRAINNVSDLVEEQTSNQWRVSLPRARRFAKEKQNVP